MGKGGEEKESLMTDFVGEGMGGRSAIGVEGIRGEEGYKGNDFCVRERGEYYN